MQSTHSTMTKSVIQHFSEKFSIVNNMESYHYFLISHNKIYELLNPQFDPIQRCIYITCSSISHILSKFSSIEYVKFLQLLLPLAKDQNKIHNVKKIIEYDLNLSTNNDNNNLNLLYIIQQLHHENNKLKNELNMLKIEV